MPQYPTTQWTRILAAQAGTEDREELTAELFERYWQPVFVFARRKGLDESSAQDAVQGLFLRLLERDFLSKLSPDKGRLRSYLLSAMSHYLADEREKQRARKRGGDYRLESLDTAWTDRALAATSSLSPEEAYERSWAQQIMERAFSRLAEEYRSSQRTGPFELIIEAFRGDVSTSQSELAERYQMSRSQLKSFLFRARTRFKELTLAEAGETVADPGDCVDERSVLETAVGGRRHQ